MFINFSNHPFETWNNKQIEAANKWGEIVDYPFPHVPADVDEQYIRKIADPIIDEITHMNPSAVMCQGEMTLCHAVINGLLHRGIKVVAGCSERKTEGRILENGDFEKKVLFQFVKFREFFL